MREDIEKIIDNMAEIVQILSPDELNRIFKQVRRINRSLEDMIRSLETGREYMTLDDNPETHIYYVNNLFAKAQLQKITPKGANIKVNPDIELGTIIMVKKY